MGQVAVKEGKEIAIAPANAPMAATPMEMLQAAVERGAGVELVAKLMDLQDRWETSQNRKAFDAAVADAKAKIPPIIKNRTGHNSKKYADFAAIAKVIDPILAEHGLSYRFRTRQDDRIHVTCVLSHRDGHSEENSLAGPADSTGNKNAIQAIGSTLTYLQRYSLTQALGIAASEDDDAKAGGDGAYITEDQVGELQAMIESVGADKPKFLAYMKVQALTDIPAVRFKNAVEALNAKRAK